MVFAFESESMPEISWYYAKANEQKGPVKEEELKQLLSNGELSSNSLVWHKGMDNWVPAKDCADLSWMRSTHDPPALPEMQDKTVPVQNVHGKQPPPLAAAVADRGAPPPTEGGSPPLETGPQTRERVIYPNAMVFYFVALATCGYGIYVAVSKQSITGPEGAAEAICEGVIDLFIGMMYVALGFFGRKVKWVYITGMVLFILDGILTLFMNPGHMAGLVMKGVLISIMARGLKGQVVTEPVKK